MIMKSHHSSKKNTELRTSVFGNDEEYQFVRLDDNRIVVPTDTKKNVIRPIEIRIIVVVVVAIVVVTVTTAIFVFVFVSVFVDSLHSVSVLPALSLPSTP